LKAEQSARKQREEKDRYLDARRRGLERAELKRCQNGKTKKVYHTNREKTQIAGSASKKNEVGRKKRRESRTKKVEEDPFYSWLILPTKFSGCRRTEKR